MRLRNRFVLENQAHHIQGSPGEILNLQHEKTWGKLKTEYKNDKYKKKTNHIFFSDERRRLRDALKFSLRVFFEAGFNWSTSAKLSNNF